MTAKIALYTSAKAIDAAIGKFHMAGQSLQAEAHKLACSVLAHVGKHGDIRVVLKFVQAMPEMGRANALKAWFEEYGPIAFDGNTAVHVPGKVTLLGEAMKDPFWKFKPEPDYVPVNPGKALEALIKKLEIDSAKTGRDWSALATVLKTVSVEPGKPASKAEGVKAAQRTKIAKAKASKPAAKASQPATVTEANLH